MAALKVAMHMDALVSHDPGALIDLRLSNSSLPIKERA